MKRRTFLQSSAVALTAGFTATTRGYFANEALNIGILGCGGRARHLLGSLTTIPGVKVAAIADDDPDRDELLARGPRS